MKIAVAMSGGVDSSVAAALCVEKYGKDNVFGVTMRLFCYGEAETDEKSCCSLDAVNDAKQVCDQLEIAHYALNFEKEFENAVINDFVSEYQKGNTPNPCIRCNQVIKFENLLEKAKSLGADILVTGHYARVVNSSSEVEKPEANSSRLDSNNKYRLLKGIDRSKDQSYFLYNLNQEQLSQIVFPLGGLKKTETREIAAKLGLKTAQKTESQDICFVSTSLREFLEPKVKFAVGNIITKEGNVVGKHEGLPFYTIGQRKGLGGGFSEPMYVVGVNVEKNELVVGKEKDLLLNELIIDKPHWISDVPKLPFECVAKIRYQADPAACIIEYSSSEVEKSGVNSSRLHSNNKIRVTFTEPQKAVTSGQSCVFYKGEEVVGGGIISIQI